MGNSAIPVFTALGTRFAAMLNGVVVVEVVFAWPGVGSLIVRALETRDYPLIVGHRPGHRTAGGWSPADLSTSPTPCLIPAFVLERRPQHEPQRHRNSFRRKLTEIPAGLQTETPARKPSPSAVTKELIAKAAATRRRITSRRRSGSASSAPCW